MSETGRQLDARFQALSAQVHDLQERMDQLTARLDRAEIKPAAVAPVPRPEAIAPEDAGEELVKWMGRTSLLPQVSALCFLLVVALVLRTVTDSDLLDDQIGAYLGMAYAGTLILAGWRLYARSSALAPIFTVCGALLMYSIVVETHTRFESLPSVPAYVMVMLTGAATAIISFRHHRPLPILVGTFGMCFAGVAVDYPNPFFPHLAMVLIAANILGTYATRLRSCSWLRWTLFGVTAGTLHVWGIKLAYALTQPAGAAPQLAAGWYIPTVLLFAAAFLASALLGILRSERISRFDLCLPALNGLWAFSALQHMVLPGRSGALVGTLGLLAALAHLAIAYRLGQRVQTGAPGANAFAVAGTLLAALALPVLFNSEHSAVIVSALMAPALAWYSHQWQSGGARLCSYLFLTGAAGLLTYQVLNVTPDAAPVATSLAGATLALAGFLHFRWCRRVPAPSLSAFFARFDAENRLSVFLLVAALVGGFIVLRTGAYQVLLHLPGEIENSFRGVQSTILNVAVAVLMLLAFLRRNAELRNIAILLSLVAAVKVFLFDLMGTSGVPLVASVFTFGVAIAIESVALGRWPRVQAVADGMSDGPGEASILPG